jgi:hypothetical protein
METYHAAFLRGISNVAMRSFVDALERLGLTAVVSFGTSGDLLFYADAADSASLESRIAQAVGAEAFVRSRDELSAVVAQNPYSGRKGASVFLAKRPPDRATPGGLASGDKVGPLRRDRHHHSTLWRWPMRWGFLNETGGRETVGFSRPTGGLGEMDSA